MKQIAQDVFKNSDTEILSAAIDSNGEAWCYTCPKSELMLLNSIWAIKKGVKRYWIGWGYDATNWRESAIDREVEWNPEHPENKLVEQL